MTLVISGILFLLFLSVFLMIVEFFFIPGTTLFGIAGFIGSIISIYFAFQESNNFGYISIIFGLIMFSLFFYFGKKMMQKSSLNLEYKISSKVNTYNDGIVNVGDIGTTITVLKPTGKAFFENNKVGVYSINGFIEKNIEIIIINIKENKIFVTPNNQVD